MKQVFVLLAMLIEFTVGLRAQTFLYEAKIKGVNKSGLYRVSLDPACRQYMHEDLRDVRIYDSLRKEIPYLVLCEPILRSTSDFVEYTIISQKHFKNYSEIIVHNPGREKTGNIAFNINNSDAHKYCAIEGSDDRHQWFSVSTSQELSLAYNGTYTHGYKCIYFPLNNYMYFRLLIEDWRSQPLKINSAGYFKNSLIPGQLKEVSFSYQTLPPEDKKTLLHLHFKSQQQIDRIDFNVKAPRLFKRHIVIYASRERVLKHRAGKYKEPVFEFDLNSNELDSGRMLFQTLPALHEKELWIEIQNKDNPPLDLTAIRCYQLAAYLICDLNANKGNAYTLKCGNDSLGPPEYELSSFVPDNLRSLPETMLEPLKTIQNAGFPEVKRPVTFFETKLFLWSCLILGALIVGFFSRSLLKEMKGQNKE